MRRPARRASVALAVAALTGIVSSLASTPGPDPVGATSPPPPEAVDVESRWARAMRRDLTGWAITGPQLSAVLAERAAGDSRTTVAERAAYGRGHSWVVIDRGFAETLGRAPDPAGRQYWRSRFDAGTTPTTFVASLAASEEMWRRGGSTATGWVDAVYRAILGRPASAADQQGWAATLAAGTTRGTIARAIRGSSEARGRIVDQEYQRLLGRSADPAGRATWVGQLRRVDERTLRARLVGSAEYLSRAQRRLDAVPEPGPEAGLPRAPSDVSADGRFVVSTGSSTPTTSPPTMWASSIDVRDRTAGTTTTFDAQPPGWEGRAAASDAQISDDGALVVFGVREIVDTTIVCHPQAGCAGLPVYGQEALARWDRATGEVTWVRDDGGEVVADATVAARQLSPSMSGDGTVVAVRRSHTADAPAGIELVDLTTGALTPVLPEGSPTGPPALAADGAALLVAVDGTGLAEGDGPGPDALHWERASAAWTRLASVASVERSGGISADGSIVAVATQDAVVPSDLDGGLDVYRWDLTSGRVDLVTGPPTVPGWADQVRPVDAEVRVSGDGALVQHRVVTGSIWTVVWSERRGAAVTPVPSATYPQLLSGDGRAVIGPGTVWALPI